MSLLGFAQNHGTVASIITGTTGTYDPETGKGDEMDSGDVALRLPGRAGNNASIEHKSAQSVTGDIEIWIWLRAADCAALNGDAVSKSENAYVLGFSGTGSASTLRFVWHDGANLHSVNSATLSIPESTDVWFRVTLDVDNGAGGHDVKFWQSTSTIPSWSQIGSTYTLAGTTQIQAKTTAIYIGTRSGSDYLLTAHLYEVRVYSGLGGTLVCNPKFWNEDPGTTSFIESSDQAATVTVNQSGSPQAVIEWYPDRSTVHLIPGTRRADELGGEIDADHKRYLLPAEEVTTPPTTEHWLGIGSEYWEINKVATVEKLGSAHFHVLDVTRVK